MHRIEYLSFLRYPLGVSYTTNPGLDVLVEWLSFAPLLSGSAQSPVPTNDWWSKVVKEGQAGNLFNYPLTLRPPTMVLLSLYPLGRIGILNP